MKLQRLIRIFFNILSIPILSVLYVGLLLSALISIVAGILRTLGLEQIKMSIWHGFELPIAFSIPLSLMISALLFIISSYVKRSIRFSVSSLNRK